MRRGGFMGDLQQRPKTISATVIKQWNAAFHTIERCVLCGVHGVQAAHSNQLRGKSQKADPWCQAALCPDDHHAIDNGTEHDQLYRQMLHYKAMSLSLIALIESGELVLRTGKRLP